MTTRRQFNLQSIGFAVVSLTSPALAFAQGNDYPNRPIKIIVPYAVGGGPDVLMRRMAVKLAEVLGKDSTVVVDNIVGAGGILAAQNVARMDPDGYNVLVGSSTHILQKSMQPSVKFDPLKDFSPVTRIMFSPQVLVVSHDSPYKTVEELVAGAKKEPGKLNYASGGVGSGAHLSGAALIQQSQIDVVHVPYKGSVEIIPSILSGDTQFAFPTASTAIPQLKAKKIRALAVTSGQRMPQLPNVPTLVESFKNPDLELDAWIGLWVPTGTPPAVVNVLFHAMTKTYSDPTLVAATEAVGTVVSLSKSPAEFKAFMETETRKLDKLVETNHLNVNR